MHHKELVRLQKIRLILLIEIVFVLYTSRIQAQVFNPPIKTFTGYIHEIYNGSGIWFEYVSKKKANRLNFRYNSKSQNIYFNDSDIVLVFYGNEHPGSDCRIDFSAVYQDGYVMKNLPKKKNRDHKFLNTNDSTIYYHSRTRRKVNFTAYDYEYYKRFDSGNCNLSHFGVFAKPLNPKMIKTSNKLFIINHFD